MSELDILFNQEDIACVGIDVVYGTMVLSKSSINKSILRRFKNSGVNSVIESRIISGKKEKDIFTLHPHKIL